MTRYKCHACEVEHSTDNMVAYCAFCYSDAAKRMQGLEVAHTDMVHMLEAALLEITKLNTALSGRTVSCYRCNSKAGVGK